MNLTGTWYVASVTTTPKRQEKLVGMGRVGG